jgi:hypothetical protein
MLQATASPKPAASARAEREQPENEPGGDPRARVDAARRLATGATWLRSN